MATEKEKFIFKMNKQIDEWKEKIERSELTFVEFEKKHAIWHREKREVDKRYELLQKELERLVKETDEEWKKRVWEVKSTYGLFRQKAVDILSILRP